MKILCSLPIITLLATSMLLIIKQVQGQITWTGTIDSVYENPGNWSPAQMPTIADDVIIPDGTPNIPVVTTLGAAARTVEIQDSLKIQAGARLSINEGNGTGRLAGRGLVVNNLRNLIIDTGGSLQVQNCLNAAIIMAGKITNRGQIEIVNCDTAVHDAGQIFATLDNTGEITGSGLTGTGVHLTEGKLINQICAYLCMDKEIRATQSSTSNQGIIVVTSSDSLVVRRNFGSGILFASGGGGVRVIDLPAGTILPVAGANYWTGCVNKDWFEPKNWIQREVPDSNDQVILAYGSGDPEIGSGTAYARYLSIDSKMLTINAGATLFIKNTSNDPGITLLNGAGLQNAGLLNISNITNHGIYNSGSQLTNMLGAELYLSGGLSGIYQESSANMTNAGLIKLANFSGDYAIQNNSGQFISQPCGIIDIVTDEGITDAADNFLNLGSLILQSSLVSDIAINSGIIHNLGSGVISYLDGFGIYDTSSTSIYWSGCIDSSWFNARNWSAARVPMDMDSVVIYKKTFNPVVDFNTANIRYLDIPDGAQFKIKPGGYLNLDASPLATNNLIVGNNQGQIIIDSGGTVHWISDMLRSFVNREELQNSANMIGQSVTLENNNATFTNSGTVDFTGAGVYNLQGGLATNYGFLQVKNSISYLTNVLSSSFQNYGEISFSGTLGTSIQNESNASFTNHACASLMTSRRFIINSGTITNQGYIGYLDTNFVLAGGSYVDEGFQYDPNGVLPNGIGTVEIGNPITHVQFTGDYDGDGNTYCSGDLDDLCTFYNPTQYVTSKLDNGSSSLREVIRNTCPGAIITIQLAAGDTIKLDSSIVVDKDLIILGRGTDGKRTIIDGARGDFSLFKIRNSARVQFRSLQFIRGGGVTTVAGGAIETSDGNNPTNINQIDIIDCTFEDNVCSFEGGAIFNEYSKATVINSIFKNNNGGLYGGAVATISGSLVAVNTVIASNDCGGAGGGLYFFGSSGKVINCTITKNHSGDVAGGIQLENNSQLDLSNSIVVSNSAQNGTGPDVFKDVGPNSIMSANNLLGDYSDSGIMEGLNGNISGDPLFIDALSGNYQLTGLSPCFNKGDASPIPPDTLDIDLDLNYSELIDIDLSGTRRILDHLPDMGAYELRNDDSTRAFQIYCGQTVTGSNTYLDRDSFIILEECVVNYTKEYLGSTWYQFTGTGDSIRFIASSDGSYVDINLYSMINGQLICLDGKENIETGTVELMDVPTEIGREYFIMIGNDKFYINDPNIQTYSLTVQCLCGNRPLVYLSSNDFEKGEAVHLRTDNTITASNLIDIGASIIYNGAQGIFLNHGFSVGAGAVFEAQTSGCN